MIKKIFLSIAIIISCLEIKAQIGEWELHPSYHNATKCEIMDGKIYVLASGALFSYQKEDGEIRTYNKINTLSDINISFITYSKHINAIIIVYENANIDIPFIPKYCTNSSFVIPATFAQYPRETFLFLYKSNASIFCK